ncbi:hypothetical protein MIMGU_mgv1a024811mg, partial [Erythranthe guttata]
IFGLFPGILAFGMQNRLKPLLEEFRYLGFSPNEVRREVLREPKVLGLENGELSHCAGYEAKLRIDFLIKHRLIYRYTLTVLWNEPRVILHEVDDIDINTAFVREYLWVNFEKKIVPRFNVIEYLRSSDRHGDEVHFLNSIATMNDIFTRRKI